MKKLALCTLGILTACLLGGCQFGTNSNSETEELRRQVADLQQQITELQQADTANVSAPAPADETLQDYEQDAESAKQPAKKPDKPAAAEDDITPPAEPAPDTDAGTQDTLESLTALVDDFTSKIDALLVDSRNKELEQFFSYKQEAAGIDRELDRYEDELERQVRDGSLSRDDYKDMERELEGLEDRLDNAEDSLEYYYGMDD